MQKNNLANPFIPKKISYPGHMNTSSRKKDDTTIEVEDLDLEEDMGDMEDVSFLESRANPPQNRTTMLENEAFVELLGQNILLSLQADQLNILGQTFRPVFSGRLVLVTDGFIQLDPVIIKLPNAPFHRNPFPLNFPINRITFFVPFDPNTRFPIQ